ncbi:putative secreted protein (Por secretion system target) [Aquimarina sp. MAR_2010_214]|uniref:leucine-rich repeat domain-containing protein n=1 Tax=Aquimarina sp. MAR_2010_214 TaxID=1250026 RepID=UPI000C70829F|nr:immunoglobulin domain-containing protein [Aquimarina sp. MAR_2010_214]PKV49413.1 putative secreted protein (Por secretion system target) [Aquimarina sp. MAR_2010_214]
MRKILFVITLAYTSLFYSQTNLIQNGELFDWDFEGTPLNWTIEGNVTQSFDESTIGGTSALFVHGTTTPKLIVKNLQLDASKTYRISFDYKIKTASTPFNDQQLVSYQYSPSVFGGSSSGGGTPAQNFEWNSFTQTITPFTTEGYDIEIFLDYFGNEPFEVYIDNIRLFDVDESTRERDALIALYNATDGPNWQNSWNLNTRMDRWSGLVFDENNHVVQLNLFAKRLKGNIPAEIGNLIHLKTIRLMTNELSGPIPPEIGNLVNLEYLYLERNLFTSIPNEIGNLTKLKIISLYFNELEGNIPVGIGNLSNLESINLSGNKLSGTIPVKIKDFSSLSLFNISNNKFVFDDFENEFSTYNTLDIFSYSPQARVDASETIELIPGDEITLAVTATSSINNKYRWRRDNSDLVDQTNRTLVIPNASNADLGRYTCFITNDKVPGLTLQKNFTQIVRYVPQIQKDALIALYNATNGPNWVNPWDLTADVSTWHGVFLDDSKNVQAISLTNNNLTGTLPEEIGNLTFLDFLQLNENQLSATIPTIIGNLTNLKTLNLSDNLLSGEIPIELFSLTKLNNLTIYGNQLEGSIPAQIGNLTELRLLKVSKNKLSGKIPTEIKNLTKLTVFGISENHFVFEDFEDDFNHYNGLTTFQYAPQANINTQQTATTEEGASYIFAVRATTSPNNIYQWRKNGVNISGANDDFYNIPRTNSSHVGVYDCIITNRTVTNLEIRKEPVTLNVQFTDTDNDGVSDSIDLCPGTFPKEAVNSDGCAQSQLDNDKDGVTNDLDLCPDTLIDDVVDTNGCSRFQLNPINPEDIEILVTSTSCPDVSNGKIKISFKKDYTYTVTLYDSDNNTSSYDNIDFKTDLVIDDLSEGKYQLCIAVLDNPYYNDLQCYNTIVKMPESMKILNTKIDDQNKTAFFEVSGSKYYKIELNSKSYEYHFIDTNKKEVIIKLENGLNEIEIKTNKTCQGKFNTVIGNNQVVFYPQPAKDYLTISGLTNSKTSLVIRNLTGNVVLSSTITSQDSKYNLPIDNLATGMYLVTITTKNKRTNIKMLKQ